MELLGEGAAHDFGNVLDLLLRQSPQRLLEPPGRQAEEVNKSFSFSWGSIRDTLFIFLIFLGKQWIDIIPK